MFIKKVVVFVYNIIKKIFIIINFIIYKFYVCVKYKVILFSFIYFKLFLNLNILWRIYFEFDNIISVFV